MKDLKFKLGYLSVVALLLLANIVRGQNDVTIPFGRQITIEQPLVYTFRAGTETVNKTVYVKVVVENFAAHHSKIKSFADGGLMGGFACDIIFNTWFTYSSPNGIYVDGEFISYDVANIKSIDFKLDNLRFNWTQSNGAIRYNQYNLGSPTLKTNPKSDKPGYTGSVYIFLKDIVGDNGSCSKDVSVVKGKGAIEGKSLQFDGSTLNLPYELKKFLQEKDEKIAKETGYYTANGFKNKVKEKEPASKNQDATSTQNQTNSSNTQNTSSSTTNTTNSTQNSTQNNPTTNNQTSRNNTQYQAFNYNSFDYFSAEELKKSQLNLEYYKETLLNSFANEIEQKGYSRNLNEIRSRSLPLDPTTLINNQRQRDIEAIETLEAKQNAARRAGNTQALNAINSAQNQTELAVLNGTKQVMDVVNEMAFKKEKEKLLAELKRKTTKEIDNLYQKVANPLTNTKAAYMQKAAIAWKKEDEQLAASWALYYDEILVNVNQSFSYSSTNWAFLDKMKQGVNPPAKSLALTSAKPSSSQAMASAKRKLYYYTNGATPYLMAKNELPMVDVSALRKLHSAQNIYFRQHLLSSKKNNATIDKEVNLEQKANNKEVIISATLQNKIEKLNDKYAEQLKKLNGQQKKSNEDVKSETTLKNAAISLLSDFVMQENINAEGFYYLGFLTDSLEERARYFSLAYAQNPANISYKEDAYWHQVLKEDNVELFKNYLKLYPTGFYAADATTYLQYRDEINLLDAAKNDIERKNNIETYQRISNTSLWYRPSHLKTELAYKEIAAEIAYQRLKKNVNSTAAFIEEKDIIRFVNKYEGTSYVAKAEKLIPFALANKRFNNFSMNLALSPFSSAVYTMEGSKFGLDQQIDVAVPANFSLSFPIELNLHKNIAALNKKGSLALGYLARGSFEFNFLQSTGTEIRKSQFNDDFEGDAKIVFGNINLDLEVGLGLSRYLYGTIGYKINPEIIPDRDSEAQEYASILSSTKGLVFGLTSNIPLGKMAFETIYKTFSSDNIFSKNLRLRFYFHPQGKNNVPLRIFIQYDYLNATNEEVGRLRFEEEMTQKMYSIGLRIAMSY